jgi:hypothetical protein
MTYNVGKVKNYYYGKFTDIIIKNTGKIT